MPAASSRRLLHLLTSPESADAIPVAVEQQRAGMGAPLLVIAPGAAGLALPTDIDSVRLSESGAAGTIDYRKLLKLIDEAASVSVW